MGLYARWTDNSPGPTNNKIAAHTWGAALREHSRGQLTRQQIIDNFNLTGDEVTEFDALRVSYQALSTDQERMEWITAIESCAILAEIGFYTEAKCKNSLGF